MVDTQLLLMHDAYHSHYYSAAKQSPGYRAVTPLFDTRYSNAPFTGANSARNGDFIRASSSFQLPDVAYDTEGETCDSESDDFMDDEEEDDDDEAPSAPDDPSQLLAFVGAVSADIRTLFSRNKDAEDFCDVYEERFKSTLSGRELYYADLLALASNSDGPRRRKRAAVTSGSLSSSSAGSPTVAPAEHTVVFGATGEASQCTLPHEGRCVAAYGLGPLEELFCNAGGWRTHEYPTCAEAFKGFQSGAMPMTLRKLPDSFWEEPGHEARAVLPAVSAAPDFHDLFTHWTT